MNKPDENHRQDYPERDQDVVFYYSRSHRLARASPAVKALYDPSTRMKRGFFKVLVGTKSNKILFSSIAVVAAMAFVLLMFVPDNSALIGGCRVSASASSLGGSSFIILSKTINPKAAARRPGGAWTGEVDVAVSPVQLHKKKNQESDMKAKVETPIAAKQFFFTLNDEEEFRFSVPFTARRLLILVQAGREQKILRVSPTHAD
jgi:hypothetical protein